MRKHSIPKALVKLYVMIVIFFTLLENLLRFHEAVQRVLGCGGSLHYLLGGVDDTLCQVAGV